MALPALRPLEIFPVDHNGDVRFCVRDVLGITDKMLLLTRPQVVLAASLDGFAGPEDLRAIFEKAFPGSVLPLAEIEKFVKMLDENFLLETPRFETRAAVVRDAYRALPSRPAALAGASYPKDPKELDEQLGGYFKDIPSPQPSPHKWGEGAITNPSPRLRGEVSRSAGAGRLVGLVSPHIDFTRGNVSYALAYNEVLKHGLADLYVILGVAHVSPPTPFVLTLKDFETPFGTVACDQKLAKALHREVELEDLLEHEFAHRSEHSIEFQAVWLAWCRRKLGGDFKILPLLCSSAPPPGSEGSDAAHEILEALAKLLKDYPGKVCLLSGADMAHVGPRFGDKQPVAKLLDWMEAEDRNSIERVLEKDAVGFHRSVMHDGGKRKVCGLASLYAFDWLLKELRPEAEGRLLRYAHAPDPAGGEVSFASLSFTTA